MSTSCTYFPKGSSVSWTFRNFAHAFPAATNTQFTLPDPMQQNCVGASHQHRQRESNNYSKCVSHVRITNEILCIKWEFKSVHGKGEPSSIAGALNFSL